jgi:hypothetical protein
MEEKKVSWDIIEEVTRETKENGGVSYVDMYVNGM